MLISVIIPVRNGGNTLRHCLRSISRCQPPPDETIVVADGYSDGAWEHALSFDHQVLLLASPGDPARARNHGARIAKGDILFFIDADTTVCVDALTQVRETFSRNPEIAAVFGLYDDEPYEMNLVSQYKNLQHHFVHNTSSTEASTFWSACGAIRRQVFLEIGGFDESFKRPSIEDIELGYRLRENGHRIRLEKSLLSKHMKRWNFFSLVRTDFIYRALPWTELILKEGRLLNDLNLRISDRASVVAIVLLVVALSMALFIPGLIPISGIVILVLIALNNKFYAFLTRKRGLCFVIRALPLHWFYFLYSGLAFGIGLLKRQVRNVSL